MSGRAGSRRRRTDDSRLSSVENMSEKVIKRRLRLDALKYPTTFLPLIMAILFLIVVFVPPVFGPLWAIIVLIGSVLAAAGSFFWRYEIRYNKEYARRVGDLMEHYEQEEGEKGKTELDRLREDIQTGFSRANSIEGLKALQELVNEYEQLQPALERGRETDPMAVAHIPGLAEETYRQGLGVLSGCVDLMREIKSPNNEKLRAEVGDLEAQIGSLRGDEAQADRLSILEATVASHKERLDLIDGQQLRVDGLLHQSDSCEASLHRTRVELAALKADNVQASVTTVTDALQRTITQAKEIQEELRKLGY